MSAKRECASCGVELTTDAIRDVCPKCLLEAGMQPAESLGDHAREDATLPPDTAGLEQPTLAGKIHRTRSNAMILVILMLWNIPIPLPIRRPAAISS